jgi:FKBP-type peptidyl-prolyl cis-trans isomerase FklB
MRCNSCIAFFIHTAFETMKLFIDQRVLRVSACALSIGLGLGALQGVAAQTTALKNDKEKLSYSIGLEVARNFKRNAVEVDPSLVLQGLNDGLSGAQPAVSEKEFKKIIQDFQSSVRQRMVASRQVLTVDNFRKAEAFLLQNKTQDGVREVGNGVQYRVLKDGDGRQPDAVDSVTIAYRGSLLDGSVFDSTETGRPGTTRLVDLGIGLRSAIKTMKVGSRWQVWVPPHLGYGERGVGNDVGPNELLIYDIELLKSTSPDGRQ